MHELTLGGERYDPVHVAEPEAQVQRPPRRMNHHEWENRVRMEARLAEVEADERRRERGDDDPRAAYLYSARSR